MPEEKGVAWHGARLSAHLRNAHHGTLRLQIRDYLRLFRLVNGDAPAEEVILMAVNDALRNAINHFADSGEACFNSDEERMEEQLFLGFWHFSLASLLTLLPFVDLFEQSIGLLQQYLARDGRRDGAQARGQLQRLRARNSRLKARARELREERQLAGSAKPPTPPEAKRLEKLVEDLGLLVDDFQQALDRLISDFPDVPPLIELSRRATEP